MVAVLALVLIAAVWVTFSGDAKVPGVVIAASIALVVVLVVGLLAMRLLGMRGSRFLPGRFQDFYGRFQDGTLKSFRGSQLPVQLALGVVGWMLEIARFYFVAEALGLDIGFGIVMFAALANAMLTTIPTPGGFGFVEGGLTGLLVLLGIGDTDALSLTVVDRSISWLSVVLFGGLLFVIWQYRSARRSGRKLGAKPTSKVPPAAEPEGGPNPG